MLRAGPDGTLQAFGVDDLERALDLTRRDGLRVAEINLRQGRSSRRPLRLVGFGDGAELPDFMRDDAGP
jgi:hypothetical protein